MRRLIGMLVLVLLTAYSGNDASAATDENTWCGYKTSQWSNETKSVRQFFIVQFRENGKYYYAQGSGIWTNGKWVQNGDDFELSVNNRYIVMRLKRVGDTLRGHWKIKVGHSGSVDLNKSCDLK